MMECPLNARPVSGTETQEWTGHGVWHVGTKRSHRASVRRAAGGRKGSRSLTPCHAVSRKTTQGRGMGTGPRGPRAVWAGVERDQPRSGKA